MTRALQVLSILGLAACLVVQWAGRRGAPWITDASMFVLAFFSMGIMFVAIAFHPRGEVSRSGASVRASISLWDAVRGCPPWMRIAVLAFVAVEAVYLAVIWRSMGLGLGDTTSGLVPPRPSIIGALLASGHALSFAMLEARRRLDPFAR